MSLETSEWLNQNTLIGFTSKRGKAWHYRASSQGDEPNHYEGPVPVDDVIRRLFHFNFVEQPVFTTDASGKLFQIDDRKAIVRDDKQLAVGIFKNGYRIHNYREWLIDNVVELLNTEAEIASAGLLKEGAVAWVQVERPDNVTSKHGVEIRPFVVAATAHDGSLASTYRFGGGLVVCDNTLAASLAEAGPRYKVKHSKYSTFERDEALDVLGVLDEIAADLTDEIDQLCETPVTPEQFQQFLDELVPIPEDEGRARTIAANKQEKLNELYTSDERASTWNGTAFGVLQAANTYAQHIATVRNTNRVERNMEGVLTGRLGKVDETTLETLNKVLEAA